MATAHDSLLLLAIGLFNLITAFTLAAVGARGDRGRGSSGLRKQ